MTEKTERTEESENTVVAEESESEETEELLYHADGDLVPEREATVSVRDRGFRYGDAAFETVRVYGGSIFRWEGHHERLEGSLSALGMPEALPADLRGRIDATLEANDLREAAVRATISRGVQPGVLDPRPADEPTVVIEPRPLPRGGIEGPTVWDEPAVARSVETQVPADAAIPAEAKTANYLPAILARLELRGTDADVAIMCDADGHVAEATTSNVFFVREGTLHTPSLDGPVLPGITRAVVLDLAEDAGIPTETGTYEHADLRAAEEAFLTNSSWELRPVASLDGMELGGGSVTSELCEAFDGLVEREHY